MCRSAVKGLLGFNNSAHITPFIYNQIQNNSFSKKLKFCSRCCRLSQIHPCFLSRWIIIFSCVLTIFRLRAYINGKVCFLYLFFYFYSFFFRLQFVLRYCSVNKYCIHIVFKATRNAYWDTCSNQTLNSLKTWSRTHLYDPSLKSLEKWSDPSTASVSNWLLLKICIFTKFKSDE